MNLKVLLTISIISLLVIAACNKEKNRGEIVNYSDCKNLKSTDTISSNQSCIEYQYYDSSRLLHLKHINAGFNCCPTSLTCTVDVSGNTIRIEEIEKSSDCDCNCLYDLDIEIKDIDKTNYTLEFVEPYCGNQEQLIFTINLTDSLEGLYCVTRENYPWGVY